MKRKKLLHHAHFQLLLVVCHLHISGRTCHSIDAVGVCSLGGGSLVKESMLLKDKKWKKEILRLFGIGVGVGLKSDKPKVHNHRPTLR
jgi:hypothetical protein